MFKSKTDRRIRLLSQGYNTWKVQILFQDLDLGASEISDRLREVKQELAAHFGVPDRLLEYTRLLSKTETRNGLLVQIQITRQNVPSGRPVFHVLPAVGDDGTVISEMRVLADLRPYDEFDQILTVPTVEARLKAEGIDTQCIDWPALSEAIDRAVESYAPVEGVLIGQGVMPGAGVSSHLTYGIRHGQDNLLASAWMGVRPVAHGDFVAEVSTAVSGHGWGRNVYGRELEPRKGLQTDLVEAEGTRLVMRNRQLIAVATGLLLFQRVRRDKRERDAHDMLPARLVARVLPALTFHDSQTFQHHFREPVMILADVSAGSRIHSEAALYIEGSVCEGAEIVCEGPIRIMGQVRQATVASSSHLCILGDVRDATLRSGGTLQIEGRTVRSQLQATDVIAGEIEGGSVEALHQTTIERIIEESGPATAIRVNLRKFLEHQQRMGYETLEELSDSLRRIIGIFGPEIVAEVTDGSSQRLLLKWLREKKHTSGVNYTHAEMQELREILEMIPLIRDQLQAIGMELKDVTAQLTEPAEDSPAAAVLPAPSSLP